MLHKFNYVFLALTVLIVAIVYLHDSPLFIGIFYFFFCVNAIASTLNAYFMYADMRGGKEDPLLTMLACQPYAKIENIMLGIVLSAYLVMGYYILPICLFALVVANGLLFKAACMETMIVYKPKFDELELK